MQKLATLSYNRLSMFLGLVFLLGLLSSCGKEEKISAPEEEKIPVIVEEPLVKDLTFYTEAIGYLTAAVSTEVRVATNGKIASILVNEGDTVSEGAPLLLIDPFEKEIKIEELKAQIALDDSSLKSAEKKLKRYQSLTNKGLIAESEWEELESALTRSKAILKLDEIKLKELEHELAHCTVTAPFDGIIGRFDLHKGDHVEKQAALFRIADLSILTVKFKMSEKDFLNLKDKPELVEVSCLCSGAPIGKANVTFIEPQFDKKSGLVLLKARLENQNLALKPGQKLKVKIPSSSLLEALTLPKKSIRYNQDGPYVYVVDKTSETAHQKKVVLGKEFDSKQVVLSGIDKDESVISEGHLRLYPGAKVKPRSQE